MAVVPCVAIGTQVPCEPATAGDDDLGIMSLIRATRKREEFRGFPAQIAEFDRIAVCTEYD
jgi:hypothetical protein